MLSTKIKPLTFEKSRLNKQEWNILKKLNTPEKIQDFLNSVPFNFEKDGETHYSVRYSLKHNKMHCLEGAMVAAAALWIQGERPLLFDLVTVRPDLDHITTLFKKNGGWGAISKTNHSVLRYRDPIYKNMRELALSYFHEYFLPKGLEEVGKKTLRKYSEPFDLSRFGTEWLTSSENLAFLAQMIDVSPHKDILTKKQIRSLRLAEKLEIEAGEIVEYKKPKGHW